MNLELKENRPPGTKAYPYDQSYIHKISHTFQFPVHWHHEFEIIYIAQGSLDISISEQLYQGTSGDIYFVNSKELHFMGSADRNVAYYTMLFPLEFISLQTDDALETELMRPLRNGILQFPHHLPNNADKENLSAILNKIISLNPCSDFPSQIRTRAFLLEFIAELKQTQNFFMENYGVSNTFQRELLAFIHGHFMESLSLTTLAGRFHLSEKYLSLYFKEHFQLPVSVEEIKSEWIEMAKDKYAHEVPLKPGALRFLKHLKAQGIPMGIATSSSRELLEAVLESLNLSEYMDYCMTSCEAGAGKPAPDIYEKVAEKLGAAPEECLVFEDTIAGIQAGQNAGSRVCAVAEEQSEGWKEQIFALADYYIESFDEILDGTYRRLKDTKQP